MPCSPRLVTAYVDGEVGGAERPQVQAHVVTCPNCGRQARQETELRMMLRTLPEPRLPASLRIWGGRGGARLSS